MKSKNPKAIFQSKFTKELLADLLNRRLTPDVPRRSVPDGG